MAERYGPVDLRSEWYPFDSIPQALLFPGLGYGIDKIRFGFVGLFLRLTNNWRALEHHTADAVALMCIGDRDVHDLGPRRVGFALPVGAAIFLADPAQLPRLAYGIPVGRLKE